MRGGGGLKQEVAGVSDLDLSVGGAEAGGAFTVRCISIGS